MSSRGRCRWMLPAILLALSLNLHQTARSQSPGSPGSGIEPSLITPLAQPTEPLVEVGSEADADADVLYRQALELERARDWTGAIKLYQDALERWPARVEFRHRLRLCETHYRLSRRYQDRSFREILLQLPQDRALQLFEEVLSYIQKNYVDAIALEPLLRRGFDNLEVALRDPSFLQTNCPSADAEQVLALRDKLLDFRQSVLARDRGEANSQVLGVCSLAQRSLRIPSTAVILEFTYGACESLDDYSSYLTPDRLEDLYAMIDGNFVGLGVELKLDEQKGLLIVNVLKGGPASDAGLIPGDHIVAIDGKSVLGADLDAAANCLQGLEGSQVAIEILRSSGASRSMTLTRRPVEVRSVAEARIVDRDAGVGYIQLIGFQKSSTDELDAALRQLQSQGMRTAVLDLRGNPGGLLNVAVDMADSFLNSGIIVSTRGRAQGQSLVYRASGRPRWVMPLIVLVDHDSASASEILAGALQDHRRALVLGEQSYGKGSVQSIFPLRAAPAGLKLTTARFYSPLNRPYSEQGVMPNTVIRTAARPAGEDPELPDPSRGDPERDPVLRAAIQAAQQSALRRAG